MLENIVLQSSIDLAVLCLYLQIQKFEKERSGCYDIRIHLIINGIHTVIQADTHHGSDGTDT